MGRRISPAFNLLAAVLTLAACASAGAVPSATTRAASPPALLPSVQGRERPWPVDPSPPPDLSEPLRTPSPTALPGCGTGEDAFRALAPKLSRVLRLGRTAIEMTTAGMAMRDGTYAADDVIPGFIGLSRDEHVVAIPRGGTARLVGGHGMTLTGTTVRLYRWSNLSFRSGGLPDVKGNSTDGSATPDGRGGLLLKAPPPGDYAVELGVGWMTSCLEGGGVAYARVAVR